MADTITPLVTRVGRRLRAQRGLEAGARSALWMLGAALPAVVLLKLLDRTVPGTVLLVLGSVLLLLGLGWGALAKLSPLTAAQRIDRAHGTHDLIASALGFAALQPGEQTAFMHACIAQAERLVPSLDPRRAARVHAPRSWPIVAGLAAMHAGLWLGSVWLVAPAVQVQVPPPPRAELPALAAHEDLDAFADELHALGAKDDSSELLRQAARDADQLIERLATRSLDRIEALQALRRIEASLRDGLGVDAEELKQALAELGRALGRAPITESLAEALREGEAGGAQSELAGLSARVRSDELRAADAKSLQEALKRAGTPPENEARERAERARNELDRLLKKRSEQTSGEPPTPPSLLDKKRRELDRLERDSERAEQRKRELDRLRRELDQAAQDMAAQRSQEGASAMDRAAQELQRMAQQAQSQARGSQMSRTLGQLREAIERAGQQGRGERSASNGGESGQSQAAGNRQAQAGNGQGSGAEQGQPLSLQRFSKNANGEKGSGAGQGSGNGQQGQDPQGQQGLLLREGKKPGAPGEQAGVMPGGASASASAQDETTLLDSRGQGAGHGGTPGQEHDTQRLAAEHTDSKLTGVQGRGPTRSEVIREASAHGFASRDYEKVLGDYRQHAESVLERDEIPGGYRYYVRRYFQLIRPRETPQ